MTDENSEQPAESPQKSVRQRVTDRWNSLNIAGKAFVVGGVVITVVVGLILLANAASSDENEPDDTDYPDDSTPVAEEPSRQYVTQGVNVLYTRCSHSGCQKKMDPRIIGHDCCGRCQTSKVRDCQEAADRAYQGPGGFRHNYFEGALFPGVCTACGEPPEGHWVLDGAATRPL